MAKFDFARPPTKEENDELLIEFERRVRPLIDEIVQAAVVAGWAKEDVLLSLVNLSWSLYEESRNAATEEAP